MDYGLVAPAEGGIGGGVGRSPDGGPGHVTFYVEVSDPEAYLAKAEKLGGKKGVPPTEIPSYNLTFAMFTDPAGHLIGLSKGAVQEAWKEQGSAAPRRDPCSPRPGLPPAPGPGAHRSQEVVVKYVVFYQSAPDVVSKARLHFPAHRARYEDFHARGTLLMIGTFA